jgi:uncharacterized SAM-binding protein YcdF (DUF218 family)
MVFLLKKAVSAIILPPGLFIVVFLAVGFGLYKKSKKLFVILTMSGIALLLFSTEYVAHRLSKPLEYHAPDSPDFRGDVIIVLGGGIMEEYDLNDEAILGLSSTSVQRILCAHFYRKANKLPVIYSGGTFWPGALSEASVAGRMFALLGEPAAQFYEEGRSIDTAENALFSKKKMEEMGLRDAIIITSAIHSRRAHLLFKQAGIRHSFQICDKFNKSPGLSFWSLVPNMDSLRQSSNALKEYLGIAFYSIRG